MPVGTLKDNIELRYRPRTTMSGYRILLRVVPTFVAGDMIGRAVANSANMSHPTDLPYQFGITAAGLVGTYFFDKIWLRGQLADEGSKKSNKPLIEKAKPFLEKSAAGNWLYDKVNNVREKPIEKRSLGRWMYNGLENITKTSALAWIVESAIATRLLVVMAEEGGTMTKPDDWPNRIGIAVAAALGLYYIAGKGADLIVGSNFVEKKIKEPLRNFLKSRK